ncbi:MAG: hypothetical protein R3F23_02790 [Verrucomicrobiia bacterium]
MQQNFSRRDFLALCGGASIAALPIFGSFFSVEKASIRIRPINEQLASASFKKFCEKARFRSLEEAVKSVRNREAFVVYQESEKAKRIWGPYGRPDANALDPCKNSSGVKRS